MEEIIAIINQVKELSVPENKVLLKEINDYLIEKSNEGKLSAGQIVFKDEEDSDYFAKLAEKLPKEASELLKSSLGVKE